jgi:site-specific DNA recombinase
MKHFVAWARVSSVKQKKEGFSLEDQESRLIEFATRLGGTIVKLFKIAETASKRDERITFREFTSYVKRSARSLDGMLFVKVDRAARNIRDWADLEDLSESAGVPLYFPDQPTGETPAGRMQRRMSAVFASYQTDQQATDIRAGHKRRVENGLPLGHQFGYRYVRVNGRSLVEHDPVNAPKVRRIFELFAYQPVTLESLAETLARQGVVHTERSPKFAKSTLFDILRNRIFIGEVRYNGIWYPGKFEPIVDRATFELVQERLGGKVFHKPQITFAGNLITCGHCGHVVTGEKKRKRLADGSERMYSYYRCTHYNRSGHPRARLTEAEIDQQFLDLFHGLRIDDPELRKWFVEVIRARVQAGKVENIDHRKELERQKIQIEGKLSALLELRMDSEISSDEYSVKRRALYDRQAGISLQLQASDQDDKEIADLAIKAFELSQSLKERWVTADYQAKRTILGIMCEGVRLNCQNLEISLRKPFDVLRDDNLVRMIG